MNQPINAPFSPTQGTSPADARPLRLGAIGLGNRAGIAKLAHLPEQGIEVVAAADPSSDAQARFSKQVPGCDFMDDPHTLLDRQDIDAVFITSPDHLHEDQAIAALQSGKGVYLEKPMAITVQGCDRILQAAQRTGQKLYVGHNMRHFPVMQKMKQLIDEGAIGEPKAAWCRHFVSYGGDAYFKDWHAQRRNTTSLLLQKGAHDIDILHWLCGGYTQRVTAMGGLTLYDQVKRRDADKPAKPVKFQKSNWPPLTQQDMNPVIDNEDISMMLMHLDNGVFASYQQCHFTPDCTRNYTIIGTQGRLENDGDIPGNALVKLWNTRQDRRCEPDVSYAINDNSSGGHGGADPSIIREFLNYLQSDAPTQTSPIAARMSVATGCAATESLRSGSQPRDVVPLPQELSA